MAKEKPHLNVVFVGHVDHGKSTTVGRLMFDAGVIPEQDMRKLKDILFFKRHFVLNQLGLVVNKMVL